MERKKLKILQNIFGEYRRSGHEYLFFCPKCGHHKKKLSINIEKNLFKCWVCDWSGRDIYRLVKRYGDYRLKQDWRSLNQQVEINDFVDKIFGEKKKSIPETLELPENFISLVNKSLPATSPYPLNYLYDRGIANVDIIKWKLGYCTEGKYASRIIIPSFSSILSA